MKNYCIKILKNDSKNNGGEPYVILTKTYYSFKEKKWVESGSLFIDKELCSLLVDNGIKIFDNTIDKKKGE